MNPWARPDLLTGTVRLLGLSSRGKRIKFRVESSIDNMLDEGRAHRQAQRHRERPEPRERPPINREADRQGDNGEPGDGEDCEIATGPMRSLLGSAAGGISRWKTLWPGTSIVKLRSDSQPFFGPGSFVAVWKSFLAVIVVGPGVVLRNHGDSRFP